MDDKIKDTEEQNLETQQPKEKEIDLMELLYKLWARKKLILLWCMWGVLAGLIIAFSIPREYTTTVKLAPEVRSNRTNLLGSLSSLASLAGISTSGNRSTDAVYPLLYPDIVSSIPFMVSLLDVPVTDKEGQHFTVREYLMEETDGPWWGVIMSAPRKLIGLVRGKSQPLELPMDSTSIEGSNMSRTFLLTPEEDQLVKALSNRITANVDQKTYVISIGARMQDPFVSAILADTVVARLRSYITEYRTNKARQDLAYAERLNKEAQEEYYKAQQRLADYIDRNQNLATHSARITRERLENESGLAFNLYNETSLQVQNAKSKVQETTPVYTEITPVTVPLKPSAPRRGLIIAGFTFLAFVVCCAWILFGKPVVEEYKNKVEILKAQDEENVPAPTSDSNSKWWKFNKKKETKD